jgi:hypothetical protein
MKIVEGILSLLRTDESRAGDHHSGSGQLDLFRLELLWMDRLDCPL